MAEADAVLEAAGLPSAELAAWRASEPDQTGSVDAAAAATCAHLARGEDLLGRLPARRNRTDAEAETAGVLQSKLDAARSRFLRAHTDAVYAALTDDLRRAVRDEELVYAAADRFPGLVPTRAQMAVERERDAPRQGGHRDRAGPVPLVRARVATLRGASRLVDAAPDRGGARATRRVPRDRRRRSRRHVSRASRAGGVSRDPERPPPECGGLRHAADHRDGGRPRAARPRGRGRRHPRRGRQPPALRRPARLRRGSQPHAPLSRPHRLPLLRHARPRLREQALPRAEQRGASARTSRSRRPRSCGSPRSRRSRSAAPARSCTRSTT